MERRSRDPSCPARALAAWKALDEPGAPAKGPLIGLVAFSLLCAVGTIGFPDYVPINVLVVPLILASLFLEPALHAACSSRSWASCVLVSLPPDRASRPDAPGSP